jgi:pyruvate dehydrogenase (quinone)
VKRLSGWGAKTIFGYPGDGITGIMGALHQAGNDPEFVQVRDEEMASLMAHGVCPRQVHRAGRGVAGDLGTGAIHLLND